jgi:replicative DNA helicase
MTIHRAVLTTQEIAETAHYFGAKTRNRYAIPVAGALQLPEQALPISPYALGVWLGDGHSYGSQITCHKDDLEIVARSLSNPAKIIACVRINQE